MKNKSELENKLVVGASIRIGKKYAKEYGFKEGEIITLVEGYFDYDNGLYTETQTAPSISNEAQDDYDSIYHLFGNQLENFMDCKVIESSEIVEVHKKDRLNKISGDCDEMYCDKCDEVTGHIRQPLINQPDKLALTCCICNNQKI